MTEETFRWVITGGVLVATLCIVIMAGVTLALYKVSTRLQGKVEDLSDRVAPIIDTVGKLTHENAPKLSDIATSAQEIASNARDISVEAKDQAHRFAEVGRDIADRTKVKVAQVDAAVDHTVEQAQIVGAQTKEVLMKPVREAGAVAAGIKAAVTTYAQSRRTPIDHVTQDEEMFI